MNKMKKVVAFVAVFALIFTAATPLVTRAEEEFTIHAKTPSKWENPGIWAWSAPDGTNAFVKWPGEKLIADENNAGWYTYSVPSWVNSVIINEGIDGGEQTVDVSVEAKELWFLVTDVNAEGKYEANVVYEAPEGFQVTKAVAQQAKDKTPDTGSKDPIYFVFGLAALSGIVIVVTKKKKAIQ